MLQFGKQSLYNMLKPIKTEDEYNDALACTYELMQTDLIENSAASDEMEILSLLIKEELQL